MSRQPACDECDAVEPWHFESCSVVQSPVPVAVCPECGRTGGAHKLDCGTGRKPAMACPDCGRDPVVNRHRPECRIAAWHSEWSRYCLAPSGDICPLHG